MRPDAGNFPMKAEVILYMYVYSYCDYMYVPYRSSGICMYIYSYIHIVYIDIYMIYM